MNQIFQQISQAINELGFSTGLIRACALTGLTIQECEEIYFQLR